MLIYSKDYSVYGLVDFKKIMLHLACCVKHDLCGGVRGCTDIKKCHPGQVSPQISGKTHLCFLFYSRPGRKLATKQGKTQQRKQPGRIKAERIANTLDNKEDVPPLKKMRMYVIQVLLFGAGKRNTTVSLGRVSTWLRRFLQEG